jgi:hypothetical protein
MSVGSLGVIKQYFEADPNGRKVTMDEMKALTREDREELAPLCAEAMGLTKGPDGKYS